MYLRRFGVDPGHQGHGVARALIDAAVEAAKGYEDLTVVAREELPNTIQFWERQGFREILRETPNVELRRPLRTFLFDVPDAEAMRELGAGLAGQLAAGDLIVLSGELGAGKTTFTQGLGTGPRRARRRDLADVRDRARPPLARRRTRPGARRRLPPRRHPRARRPRPRHVARRRRHRRRVGRGRGRGPGGVAARGPHHPRPGPRRRARRAGPAAGADDSDRSALARPPGPVRASGRRWPRRSTRPCCSTSAPAPRTSSTGSTRPSRCGCR